jgi:hypothetical protein
MSRTLLAGMLGLGLLACASAGAREPDHRDADRRPLGSRAVDRTLVAGTLIEATIHSARSRRREIPGGTVPATVSADARNAHGWVVNPAGCLVGLRIARRRPKMLLDVTSVTVRGQVYPVSATIEAVPVGLAPGARILFVLPEGFTAATPQGGTP